VVLTWRLRGAAVVQAGGLRMHRKDLPGCTRQFMTVRVAILYGYPGLSPRGRPLCPAGRQACRLGSMAGSGSLLDGAADGLYIKAVSDQRGHNIKAVSDQRGHTRGLRFRCSECSKVPPGVG
jgi:hypothetical protein